LDVEAPKRELDEAAGAELGALAVALARLHADGIGPFLEGLLSDPDDAVRAAAIEAMGILGGEQAKARQEAALADPSLAVRSAAAASLGRLGSAGVPGLSAAVKKSRPADVGWRNALARNLGETGSPLAVTPLAQLLRGGSAATAAAALGRLGAKEGTAPLLELLGDPRAPGQVEALEAVGQIGGPDAGSMLATALASDRPEVRAAAARSLGRIKYEPASPRLEALRSDYYGEVRRAAVEALAKLPAPNRGR
jgi:HEAT repeat protein